MTLETRLILSKAAQEFSLFPNTALWVGQLKKEKNRMIGFHRLAEPFYSVELYEAKHDVNNTYARVNFTWDGKSPFVRTLVVGSMDTVARYARHDHKLHQSIPDVSWEVLRQLSGMEFLQTQSENLGYYVRPSSFVCSDVQVKEVFGEWTKLVIMRYLIDGAQKGEFFAHLHSLNENTPLWNGEAMGFVFTNSPTYRDNHAEIVFAPVPQVHQKTFFTELGIAQ